MTGDRTFYETINFKLALRALQERKSVHARKGWIGIFPVKI
jgi:hypothetical protein